ncbi:MAG TPA: hypothetical protein VHJ20_19365 [Polyangia bacterium]|nr:hypothetical protein [Polyangia bacterium]
MRATRLVWSRFVGGLGLALLAFAAARCSYAPDFASGTLGCSAKGECPEGYACRASDNKCWKNGETSTGGTTGSGGTIGSGGTTGSGGKGGATGSGGTTGDNGTDLVGHWVYDATSSLTLVCGTKSMTNSLKDDYVDVGASATANKVIANYYCNWTLDVSASGVGTVEPNQSCMSTEDPSTHETFTFRGTTFTFSSSDGAKATLSSMIAASYVNSQDKSTGNCTITITGSLTKQ